MTSVVTISENARAQIECLKDASDSLRQASGGANQLAHAQRNPKFLMVRDAVDLTLEAVMAMTQCRTRIKAPTAGII